LAKLGDTLPPPPDSSVPPPPIPAPAPSNPEGGAGARVRRVIAVGGGKGGVGKTLLTVNLGVFFAQLGRDVVVCDADPIGSGMHAVLGLENPPHVPPEALEEGKAEPVATTVPGLRLLPVGYDAMNGTPVKPSRGAYYLRQIQDLQADYILVNLGAGATSVTLDLFLHADVGICVTAPEPLAVETTYRFCRALYLRILRRALMKERFKIRLVEKVVTSLPPLASPRQIIAEIKRYDDSVANLAAQQLVRVLLRLVVSQTRLRSDLELGPAMAIVAERYLGVTLDYIGHIEHDDAVWLTVRRRQPLLIDSPTSKSARNLERVARRILALLATRDARGSEEHASAAALRPDQPVTLFDALNIPRTASDEEIRRAYKRQREIYREGSLPLVSVVGEAKLRQEQARLEEAHDTLLDPVKRRAYLLSTFPDDAPVSVAPLKSQTAGAAAELAMLQAELAREINAETQFTGALLRKVRESQGIEISDIAQRTKISTAHLVAIESEAVGDLPAAVYVQGFVQQVAKFLKLDPVQVAKTYMRRLRELSSGARVRQGG
jgi:flagellar biosynthesis protein FlhG